MRPTSQTVKSEIATFFDVFPGGTIWGNENGGGGYDVVLLGQAGETKVDVDAMEKKLASADYSAVAKSLSDVGFQSAMGLLTTYAGRARDLQPWLKGAAINRDGNLRLQYLAGLALNRSQENSDLRRHARLSEVSGRAFHGVGRPAAGSGSGARSALSLIGTSTSGDGGNRATLVFC